MDQTTEAKLKHQRLLDLRRALLGEAKPGKGGPKACSICGKPDTRNHKGLNEQNGAHGEASLKAWPTSWRMLTKSVEGKVDFKTKEQWNAQIAFLTDKLLAAREEHDAYQPVTAGNTISSKSAVVGVIMATLKLLGFTLPTPAKVTVKVKDAEGKETGETKEEDGEWSVLQLSEFVNLEVAKLLGTDEPGSPLSSDNGERESTAEQQSEEPVTPAEEQAAAVSVPSPAISAAPKNGNTTML